MRKIMLFAILFFVLFGQPALACGKNHVDSYDSVPVTYYEVYYENYPQRYVTHYGWESFSDRNYYYEDFSSWHYYSHHENHKSYYLRSDYMQENQMIECYTQPPRGKVFYIKCPWVY